MRYLPEGLLLFIYLSACLKKPAVPDFMLVKQLEMRRLRSTEKLLYDHVWQMIKRDYILVHKVCSFYRKRGSVI